MKKYYKDRIELENQNLNSLKQKNNRISNLRLTAIILSAVFLYFLLETSIWLTAIAIISILTGFYFLVKYHDRLEKELGLKKVLIAVLANELSILKGKPNAYENGFGFMDEKHPFSSDLDVFGEFSLFHLINRAKTKAGIKNLAESFLKAPEKKEILAIQHATSELSKKNLWRENFQASLYETAGSKTEALIGLQNPPKIRIAWLIKQYAYLKWIFLSLVVIVFYYYSLNMGMLALFGLITFNFMLVGINKKKTSAYFQQIKGLSKDLDKYSMASEMILVEKWDSEKLAKAKENLGIKGKNPIDEFQLIAKKIEMKNNQFAAFFLYLFSPFDLVQLLKLESWIRENPNLFHRIFASIGQFEHIASIGMLAHNHADWTFPELKEEKELCFKALAVGHPLVPNAVSNNFVLQQSNRLSLITGSNMSGKSTFLRTIGCNVLMAYAGAPVKAKKIALSTKIKLYSYMRIKDSLAQNASTFKAEIDRIGLLMEAMKQEGHCILLVDEMLRGTNSEDKLKGSLAFLVHVLASNAFALVATHDLRMADLVNANPEKGKNYFFEYDSKDGELTFDYLLKPGVCQSFNASALLRRAGLDV